jgi:hypothetical protein
MIIIEKDNQSKKKINKDYSSGFIRRQNEINIIIDKNSSINFSSIPPDLIDLILSLDPDNKKFKKIKKENNINKEQKEWERV